MVEQNFQRLTLEELKKDPILEIRSEENLKSILESCGHNNPPTPEELEIYAEKVIRQVAEIRAKHPENSSTPKIPDITHICPEPAGTWINKRYPGNRNEFFDQQVKRKSRKWGPFGNETRKNFCKRISRQINLDLANIEFTSCEMQEEKQGMW